ncbi:MAG: ATP-binding protein [Mariprofundaceae bacterium]|nr:ATP-binding protein [Mariprofundaceae bacterium]
MPHKAAQAVHFSHLPVATVLVDEDMLICAVNILAQEHFNTSEQRLLGKPLTNFISPMADIKKLLQRTLLGETVSADLFYTTLGHKPYSLYFSRQNDGFISIVLIAEGNRLEAESQSRRHEMAETISRIALERAHEIKNPLAALRGATQLLNEQVNADEKVMVTQMLLEIDRIRERVDGFLQVGPRANIAMQPVNIHVLLDDVCKGSAVRVQRVYDPSIPEISLHEKRFRQAIENLWTNAVEAHSDIIIWETRITHGIVLTGHTGAVLAIKIISNGQSIPENIQKHLFEPYVTAKSRGNGLGLSIVQQVVYEHGGKVQFHSERERSVFTIYLPLNHNATRQQGQKTC